MATTVSYSASLRTRKTTSSSNFKSDAAAQEYYVDDYNLVGIINFSGLSLAGKLITTVSFTFTSDAAGYGDWYTKTVYLRKSLYQAASESNITGGGYYGDALGTFTGSFYNNTTSYAMSGTLLTNIAAYLALGNNTFCIYNPSPVSSSNGYATNYLQWSAATITVTYEEAVSQPTVSASSVDMGSAVTIYTNRQSTSATHTLLYSFGGSSGTIATGVGASYAWTPSVTLAQQIPSATAGTCTITCQTYYGATLTGTRTVSLTLTVPSSVIPSISNVVFTEAIAGLAAQFGGFVQSKSRLAIVISALGIQGSTISSYRTVLNGVTYSGDSLTSNVLTVAGDNTMTVTVTDSRGRTASTTRTVTVIAYTSPSLSQFSAERCNPAGTAPQVDGVNVRVSAAASVSSVNSHNTMACTIYYKLSTASSWISVLTPTITNYAVTVVDQLLSATFDTLHSYDVMIRVTDWFGAVEQSVSIGTKQVLMDFYNDGSGIAFGKVAEETGKAAFGWPLSLDTPLAISEGGTGQTTAAGIRNALGLGNTTDALPVANGGTGQTSLTNLRNAMGLGNTTGAVPIANGGTGAATAADARTNLGVTLAALGAAAASHTHAASAITSGTLAAARLPYVCYPVNDDSLILRAFMGFQPGGPADFCMYVQAPVSWLLYGLGIVFPGVAWFTILQILFLWFSNAVIIKSILRCFIRRGKPFWSGIAAAAAFFALFSLYATARITYTVTAAMLGAAAAAQMMSINAKTASRRRYIWHSLPALVMMALAYGLRSIAVVPAFGYFCIVVAYHAFTALGPGKRPPRALRPLWITVLIVVVMLGGLYGLRSWEVTAKGQGDYAAWSEARTAVTDYLQPDKISGDVYEQAGWSDAEVELLSTWYTMDADYSTQAFETVAALAGDEARTSPGAAVLNLRTRSPLIVLSFVVLLCFGIVCLLWLRWFHRGEGFRQTAVLITVGVLCLELFSFLALKGRLPRHAAQVPVLPAAAVVFCLLPECLPDRRALAGWKRAAAAGTLTLLTAATLACAVPTAYAIRKVPSQWSYNVFADMDAQALARPDRLWIYGGDLINDTRLFPDVSAGIPDNLMFWGGWQRGSEEYLARLAAFGIDGHTFGAEDWLNPAVRYLSLAEEPNEALLTYLREKTGQTVLYEREKLSDGLYGYRFYLPE